MHFVLFLTNDDVALDLLENEASLVVQLERLGGQHALHVVLREKMMGR